MLEGSVTAYYSEGAHAQADSLVSLLGQSVDFFEREVGLHEDFSIAVLDPDSWAKLTPIPYGLPFVSGPPYVVCFPADTNHELHRLISQGIAGSVFSAESGLEETERVNVFVSLIGFHELGHIYSRKMGLTYPNNWIFEFMASYFAYFYLDEHFPCYGQVWEETCAYLARRIEPAYRTLGDFERLYVRVGVETYAWYQMVFLLRVAEVFRVEGGQFLRTLKDHEWEKTSEDFHVGEMEQLMPGFLDWTGRFNMLETHK
ncbi:MAG: hypothetical protein R6V45_12130 [Oceanipulchritudo sp.]